MLESFPGLRDLRIAPKTGTDEWIAQCTLKVASETKWQDSAHSVVNVVEAPFEARVIRAAYVSFGIRRPGKGDFVFGRREWNAHTD
jgi:hypothetical protein